MKGRAAAPAAGTILCAFATGYGSAFGIDKYGTATVELDNSGTVTGAVKGKSNIDTTLIERCAERCIERFGDGEGATVTTDSDIPMAAGLKSSSVVANASVLATLDALDVAILDATTQNGVRSDGGQRRITGQNDATSTNDADHSVTMLEATRIGVNAARDANVTTTGAFDDATASMFGGVTVTDNSEDELIQRDTIDWDVLVWTPPKQAFSSEVDHDRCKQLAPVADEILDMVVEGRYKEAMMLNGFAFCTALRFTAEPILEALPATKGVSLSGSGPSFVAVGERESLESVKEKWELREGSVWFTTTVEDGARIL
ncbi:shikimate kinase [Salinadaptatus halalkaliphilus]|uniref:Shikimate kinase n=1 Tax=Salinadaptatus halalkaliphilus TaxID=2419781 RepID=A0A4S3TIX8_9EURY|nr:shikimate kinase [Salinadaptatus halalkaliphilus]THE63520.1 shikimate kinase [Salinadaptatus halalkaliphilus]